MNQLLSDNPLLLLFLVAALGYLIGTIKIKGASLGVAAVLFVGLGFGMINPAYNVPEIIFQLGLVFFVYSIGLSSGPVFFESFKKNGYRDLAFVLVMLTITASSAVLIHYLFGFNKAMTVGLYSGSTTNTTALAAVTDLIKSNTKSQLESLVVGYTFSYPMGVLGVMIVLKISEKVLKIDYAAEMKVLRKSYPLDTELSSRSILVTNRDILNITMRDIMKNNDWNVIISRVKTGEDMRLVNWDTYFHIGDAMMMVGSTEDLDKAQMYFGEEANDSMYTERKEYDIQQIFVSNTDLVGQTIASLNLNAKYDAIITRIRRGDVEMLAQQDTVLELGDRIRFIAKRKDLKELSKLFGDSYFESSSVNLFSFGLGMALGLLLGFISISLPGGLEFKLGLAGGPLVMGLFLGSLRRTGPIVWTLPYSANVTLRQLGLILLLAVVGLQSGNSFLDALNKVDGLYIFLAGTMLSMFSAFVAVMVGYKLFKIPFSMLLGFMSNQPAILEFANDMAKNRAPVIGYALMFPIALIMKILFAQILYLVL